MAKKAIFVCTKRDIVHPISWALKEFEKLVNVRYFDTTAPLAVALADGESRCVVILDSVIANKSTIDFAKEIKQEKPSIRILLIASSETPKGDIVGIIQSKAVSGVLVRPFTVEQISNYIYKLCGFEKPSESPWYMQAGIK